MKIWGQSDQNRDFYDPKTSRVRMLKWRFAKASDELAHFSVSVSFFGPKNRNFRARCLFFANIQNLSNFQERCQDFGPVRPKLRILLSKNDTETAK